MTRSSIPVLILAYLVIASPVVLADQGGGTQDPVPDWYRAGLATLVDQLYDPEVGAIMETQHPLEHGDRWAWTGDNAKVLRALARAPDGAPEPTAEIARFVASMGQGPVVFQRWVNTHEVAVLDPPPGRIELSNHLLTLRGDPQQGPLEVLIEYHDKRDRVMATIGAPSALVDGTWVPLEPSEARLLADTPTQGKTLGIVYTGAGVSVVQRLTLDASPRLERTLTVEEGEERVTGVAMRSPDLTVRQPKLETAPRTYKAVSLAGEPARPVDQQGLTLYEGKDLAGPWVLYLDEGTTDAFASGLGVALEAADLLHEARATARDPARDGLLGLEHRYTWDGQAPGPISEDLVLLDGLVTDDLGAYEAIIPRIEAPGFENLDPSLIYELGEAAHGLLEAPDPDGRLQARAEAWLTAYADRYERGTQTRSLAAATMAALDLANRTGQARWEALGQRFAEELRAHQIIDDDHPAVGAVRAQTGGPPFLDATLLSMIAWRQASEVLDAPEMRTWVAQARASLGTDGSRILLGDPPADTNHWAFKSGLALQAAGAIDAEVRWAARSHLWEVTRDLASYEIQTSRFSRETNSETQAWALLGLIEDRSTWQGPWILDSESSLSPRPGPSPGVTVSPGWPGTRVWVEPGWIPYAAAGPVPGAPGPHGSVRYELPGPTTFWPAHQYQLEPGWEAIGFPGLDRPVDPGRVLQGTGIGVAWGFDAATGWQAYVPGDPDWSSLEVIEPGDGLLVHAQRSGHLEVSDRAGTVRELEAGWHLQVVPPGARSGEEVWPGAQIHLPAPPGVDSGEDRPTPFEVVWVGQGTSGDPPGPPPALVLGRVEAPEGPERGGQVAVMQDGQVLATAPVDAQGRFQVEAPADRLDGAVDLRYTPAGEGQVQQVAGPRLQPGEVAQVQVALPAPSAGPPASPWLTGALGLAILLTGGVVLRQRAAGHGSDQEP